VRRFVTVQQSVAHSIELAPALRPYVSELDLIQSVGTLYFGIPGTDLHSQSRYLFDVRADAYHLRTAIDTGQVFIERNGVRAAVEVPATPALVKSYAVWDPTMISIVSAAPAESGALSAEDIDRLTVRRFYDPPVLPPTSLIAWARRNSLVPATTYATPSDGIGAIGTALRGIQEKVYAQGMQRAFWDFVREGNWITAHTPKREVDIHPTLGGLLADVAVVRNLEFTRERPTGAGLLDFAFLAPLTGGGFARACAEFKPAQI
jgi:hypothetical protein